MSRLLNSRYILEMIMQKPAGSNILDTKFCKKLTALLIVNMALEKYGTRSLMWLTSYAKDTFFSFCCSSAHYNISNIVRMKVKLSYS